MYQFGRHFAFECDLDVLHRYPRTQAFTLMERCSLKPVNEDSNSDSSSSLRKSTSLQNSTSTGIGQDSSSYQASRNSRVSERTRRRRANATNFAWTKSIGEESLPSVYRMVFLVSMELHFLLQISDSDIMRNKFADSDGIYFTQNVKIGGLFTLPHFNQRKSEDIDIENGPDTSSHGSHSIVTHVERIVAEKVTDLTANGSRNNPNVNRLYKSGFSTKTRKGSTFDYRRQPSDELGNPVQDIRHRTIDMSSDRQFSIFGDYIDWKVERIYRRKMRQEILLSAFVYMRISTLLALFLFSSIAAVGQTGEWGTPSGLAGVRGANIDYYDVSITTWYWIIIAVLFFISFFLPGVFAAMFMFWGAHIAMGIQSFLFGLGCVVSMICTPSALTLGLPVAFIAQVSVPLLSPSYFLIALR